MRFHKAIRTDLVISMTLAEIFLLLLFVVWYGYRETLEAPSEIYRLQAENVRLREEVAELKDEIREANNKIKDLEHRLEIWRTLTGFPEPPSSDEFEDFIKEACRSNPKCHSDNTLIRVTIDEGELSMQILVEVPNYTAWMEQKSFQLPNIGEYLYDINRIDQFLELTLEYYREERVGDRECRFDYSLSYRTPEDYYEGRQKFEQVFYPGLIRQIR